MLSIIYALNRENDWLGKFMFYIIQSMNTKYPFW